MLSLPEKMAWRDFLRKELRMDENACAAERHMVAMLDRTDAEGPWCGCVEHVRVLAYIQSIMWLEPPPVG
jgi:hypothetical protein